VDKEKQIKLGIIGLSDDNGHPYSWSAIMNGYDPAEMEDCGFPVIPRYLEQQRWPDAKLNGALVTHVWTQDIDLSQKISRAAHIPHVCQSLDQMAQRVDAVLLARDDGERHLEMATPFLDAGLPLFIDKPLALNVAGGKEILRRQKYPGQIFSCSAIRYSADLTLNSEQKKLLGEIRHIYAYTPKSWKRYGMHVIDAARRFLPLTAEIGPFWISKCRGTTLVQIEWTNGISTTLHALGQITSDIGAKLYGSKGSLDLAFRDTFNSFKAALAAFVEGVRSRRQMISEEDMLTSVRMLEIGQAGQEQ
jgi:hypothetical protein